MSANGSPRPSIRVEHAQRTRQRIVDAVADLVSERGDCEFTMPEAAEASGVSVRTLYRYFPHRQGLVDAIAAVADQVAASNLPASKLALDDLGAWLADAWRNLLEQEALIRAQHTGPGGAEVRRARIPFFREVIRALLLEEAPGLEGPIVDDIIDTTLLVVSSSALLEYLDVIEIPIERAARLSADVVARAVDDARQPNGRNRWSERSGPPPNSTR